MRKAKQELLCQNCNHKHSIWYAPDDIWNKLVRHGVTIADDYQFLCPNCFIKLYEKKLGKRFRWCVKID